MFVALRLQSTTDNPYAIGCTSYTQPPPSLQISNCKQNGKSFCTIFCPATSLNKSAYLCIVCMSVAEILHPIRPILPTAVAPHGHHSDCHCTGFIIGLMNSSAHTYHFFMNINKESHSCLQSIWCSGSGFRRPTKVIWAIVRYSHNGDSKKVDRGKTYTGTNKNNFIALREKTMIYFHFGFIYICRLHLTYCHVRLEGGSVVPEED